MDPKKVSKKSSGPRRKSNGAVADDDSATKAWYSITSADIFRNRKTPKNGIDCFFSEASFNQITGPGPSFKEKLLVQVARVKFEQNKPTGAGLNKTNAKILELKKSSTDFKISKNAQANQIAANLSTSTGGFQEQILKDNLAVKRGTLAQDLKTTMTVNSGSLNKNMNESMTVNSRSLNKNLNESMAVNCGPLNKNMNETMTVNSVSTVKPNNKRKLPNCELVSSIDSFSYSSEHKNEPALNSIDGLDAHFVNRIPTASLPKDVSICEALNKNTIISNAASSTCTNKKSKVMENSYMVLEPTIVSTSDDLKPDLEKDIKNSEADICNSSPNHFDNTSMSTISISTGGTSIDKNVKDTKITNNASIGFISRTSSHAAYCEVPSSTSTASTSIMSTKYTPSSLVTEAVISDVSSQHSKQNDCAPGSEHFKQEELKQSHSLVSLSVRPYVDSTSEVSNADSSYPDNQALNENLKADSNSRDVTILSTPQVSVSVSETDPCSEEEMPLVLDIAEVPVRNLQADLLDRDLTNNENTPLDEPELCLVMPSLSSDDDDDVDDNNVNFKTSISSSIAKLSQIEDAPKEKYLNTPASVNKEPEHGDMNGINATVSTSFPPHAVNDSGNSSFSSVVNTNKGDYAMDQIQTGAQVCAVESNVPDTLKMEMPMESDYQQSSQEVLLNIPKEESTNWQTNSGSTWPEVDIPIFSVKEASPEPVKRTKSTAAKREKKKLLESVDTGGGKSVSGMQQAGDEAPKQDGNKNVTFRKSDLTKEEHARYLKLYNKYIPLFSHKGPPPVLGALQCKEIACFEKLQRRVQTEQAEFQDYLLQNAKKNPKAYTFLRTVARHYSTCKAKAYRLKLNSTSKFRQTFDCLIPLCKEASPTVLKFQQALLEVGIPPRIKLPDMPVGHKPVPIEYNIHQVESSFPKRSKMNVPGFTHHEPVSFDANVKSLATKYDFQVVMSSSVMKCLLDNHGPEFERAWNIPVHVVNHNIDDGKRTIVYLNKPVFENDLHIKDYSSLFHKYALRTFVSHPKRKPIPLAKKFQQAVPTETPCEIDDPFDVPSSNVDNLETFGEGCSSLFKQDKAPVKDDHENVISEGTEPGAAKKNQKLFAGRLRSNRKYPNWDAVVDDNTQFEKPGYNLDKILSVLKKDQKKKSGQLETATGSKLPVGDSEPDFEPKKKHSRIDHVGDSQSSEKITKACPASVVKKTCLFIDTYESPQSPEPDHSEPFNKTQSPSSPIASPASPSAMDDSCSSRFMTQPIPLSPVREIPSSPVRLSPPASRSLPCRRSPRTRSSTSESLGSPTLESPTLESLKAGNTPKMSRNSEGVQGQLFTPLDSILGPSFGQLKEKNSHSHDIPREDPTLYLPPTEAHSSLVYNLWSLGSFNVLIRTRCHGVLKDIKKTRKVYFTPKMEYQSTYGLEQVTVSEVARDWTACFIRPNTNLLRARINAFTSEILMLEELETSQILRSSLNFLPEVGFQFLDRVLQTVVNLQPGYYLLSHGAGDDFCGIRSSQKNPNQPDVSCTPVTMRKSNREQHLPWIPIDPTLLLPYHITNNRIPATFMPKDFELHNNPGGQDKRNRNNNAGSNGTDSKKGGNWRKFNENNNTSSNATDSKKGSNWRNFNENNKTGSNGADNKKGGNWRKFNENKRGRGKNKS